MKLLRVVGALAAAVLMSISSARAQTAIDFNFFYQELAPSGDWIETADYGYVWQPYGVGSGWQPYTDGQWVYTDDGWAWASNEDWGWATYHYGRWTYLRTRGWCWVPGYEWAPAWVSWRTGGGYVGWAPLPPEARWQPSTGIRVGIGISFWTGPSFYRFCPDRYFGYGNVGRYCVPPADNVTIIQNTTNITNITNVVNNNRTVIYNGGPNYDELRKVGDIRRARIDRVETVQPRAGRGVRNTLEGDRFRVVAPPVARRADAKPPRVAGRVGARQAERGWSDLSPVQRAQVQQRLAAEARNDRREQRPRVLPGQTAPRPKPLPNPDLGAVQRPPSSKDREGNPPRPRPSAEANAPRGTEVPRPLPARPGESVNRSNDGTPSRVVPRPEPRQEMRPRPQMVTPPSNFERPPSTPRRVEPPVSPGPSRPDAVRNERVERPRPLPPMPREVERPRVVTERPAQRPQATRPAPAKPSSPPAQRPADRQKKKDADDS